jgi:hypothetical protein
MKIYRYLPLSVNITSDFFCVGVRAVRFQKFDLGSGSGFFGTEKPRFGFGYFQKR